MKKIISVLLSILLSFNIVSYNPNAVFATVENVTIDEETSEVVEEKTEDILDEEATEEVAEVDEEVTEEFENEVEEAVEEEIDDEVDEIVENDNIIIVDADNNKNFGYIDIDTNIDNEKYIVSEEKQNNLLQANAANDVLPSRYNLANNGFDTSVKNQGNYGSCWAHAVLASAESTSIMDNEATTSLNLSEVNLNYYEYNNKYADQLNLITDDYSTGSGDSCVFNIGGNLSIAIMNLPSGIGFSRETGEGSRLPYSVLPASRSNYNTNNFYNTYIKNKDYCYNNDYLLINVDQFNLSDRDIVKKQLMEEGAMGVSYYSEDALYYNKETSAYYYDGTPTSNHAVTLVGWDDDFAVENFAEAGTYTVYYTDGSSETITRTRPSKKGAWIIKNSWGDDYGVDGYFYISYEDKGLNANLAYQFDIIPYDKDYRIYQYDGTFSYQTGYTFSNSHYEANNYTAQRDEYIDRVGFYTIGSDVQYTAYVYKNNTSDNKPTSGAKVAEISGIANYGGYHSIELDNPVFINKGDKFSVVVKFSGSNSNEYYIDQNLIASWHRAYSSHEKLQSYLSTDGGSSWTDVSTSKSGNLRVKGYSSSTLINSDNTYATYNEANGLVIHSNSSSLITQIDDVKIDGSSINKSKSTNDITVDNETLISNFITNGEHTITIETKDGFILSFTVTINMSNVSNDIYLAFTSDIHNNGSGNPANVSANRLNNWINEVSKKTGKFLNFASCGDMGTNVTGTSAETKYWTYAKTAIDVVKNNSNVIRDGFFVLGNHEWNNGNYANTTNSVKNLFVTNGTSYNDPSADYVFYSFGAANGGVDDKDYYIEQKDIDALDTYLASAPTDKVIFVLSHYPLHSYSTKNIYGVGETIDVLNKHSYDHTIVFLWGHSHTMAGTSQTSEKHYDKIYTNEIESYDNKGTNASINFVYAAAGCMSDTDNIYGSQYVKGKGLVAKISYNETKKINQVTLTYYGTDYNVVGNSVTIDFKDGKTNPTQYKVSFDAKGGTISTNYKYVIKNSTYGKMPTPTKTGYTFDGWYTTASGGTQVIADTKVTITAAQTLYAHWTANTYKVTFDSNGGGTPNPTSKYVTYDSTYGTLASVSRTGYTFDGWYTAKTGGTKIESTTTVTITDVQTLYAHWTVNKYIVTYDVNGGNELSTNTKEVTYGSTYGTLQEPSRTGYKFAGWYTAKTGGTKIESTTTVTITDAQTLYARWTANTYKVTFNSNGGGTPNPTSKNVTYDSTYGTLASVSRTGYTFAGWYTSVTGGTQVTADTKVTITAAQTLYAHWTEEQASIVVNVSGLSEGTEVYIDGNKASVSANGKIYTDITNPKVLTVYTFAKTSDVNSQKPTNDPHVQYPKNMKIYLISGSGKEFTATENTKLQDSLVYGGTSIRTTGDLGIRIIVKVSNNVRSAVTNKSDIISGYRVVEYGTIMCKNERLTNGAEPTIYYDKTTSAYKATFGTFQYAYKLNGKDTTKDDSTYANPLTGFSLTDAGTDFAMRPYMILRPNGTSSTNNDVVIYGGTLVRDISYVAYKVQNTSSVKNNPTVKSYIQQLINAADGKYYSTVN